MENIRKKFQLRKFDKKTEAQKLRILLEGELLFRIFCASIIKKTMVIFGYENSFPYFINASAIYCLILSSSSLLHISRTFPDSATI